MANRRRRLVGRVVSDKMQKTVVVEVQQRTMHRVYKKYIVTKKRFYAHDEEERAPIGAVVRLVESRPRSKLKRWAIEAVLEGGRGDSN